MSEPANVNRAQILESINVELAKIESLIAGAQRLVAEGRLIDLAALDGRVRSLCDAVLSLPPADGRRIGQKLQGLLETLDGLGAALQARFADMPVLPNHGGGGTAAYAALLKHFP